MAEADPHSKLITAAAREILRPLGLFQKGRSRVWLDDQGWWLGVVEFQPSDWSKGSYLNVGANVQHGRRGERAPRAHDGRRRSDGSPYGSRGSAPPVARRQTHGPTAPSAPS